MSGNGKSKPLVIVAGRSVEADRVADALSDGARRVVRSGTDIDDLEAAGIGQAEALIAADANENVNIYIAEVASVIYRVSRVIAHVKGSGKSTTLLESSGVLRVDGESAIADALARRFAEPEKAG